MCSLPLTAAKINKNKTKINTFLKTLLEYFVNGFGSSRLEKHYGNNVFSEFTWYVNYTKVGYPFC